MANEILNTADMAEREWDGHSEPQEVQTDMVATRDPEGRGIEFHVSMRDYTQRDMEALIVDAAARVLVGEYGNAKLAKLIEERCVALTVEKADRHLATVTAEIIDQPMTPKYPFMKSGSAPMTMREFIGLTGREYLTAYVNNSGEPTTDRHYGKTRMQHLVETFMGRAFKAEIEKATAAAIAEIQKEIRAKHEAALAAEKARIAELEAEQKHRLSIVDEIYRRAEAAESERDQWKSDADTLIANIDFLADLTGEGPEDEDRILVEQIRSRLSSAGGMPLRDYFAGQALRAARSNFASAQETVEADAQHAYRMADALLKAREAPARD